jgi:hypothetical protein
MLAIRKRANAGGRESALLPGHERSPEGLKRGGVRR